MGVNIGYCKNLIRRMKKTYLANDILRERLLEISEALLQSDNNDPVKILGHTDSKKVKSSMTLFLSADPSCHVFQAVLDKFYDGEKDGLTLEIID